MSARRSTKSACSAVNRHYRRRCRAVASRPDLVIADEPTGNLDPDLSFDIMRLFERFNEVGVTILIATHDLELIERLGHRQIKVDGGRLVAETPW